MHYQTASLIYFDLPKLAEIFEFDAMEDPPSVMEIDVYDFDGPFDEVASLGHAEVNFLKYNISELADIWIPLKGKLAQACQSKLHLRIFLNNTRGTQIVKDYLDKMEKEVGKKVRISSHVIKCANSSHLGFIDLCKIHSADCCEVSSCKFSIPENLFFATRRISYQ
jgi:hypothetical protein